jgi:FkbM family methyltransferase
MVFMKRKTLKYLAIITFVLAGIQSICIVRKYKYSYEHSQHSSIVDKNDNSNHIQNIAIEVVDRKNNGNKFSIWIYKNNDIVSKEIRRSTWEADKILQFNKYFIDYSKKHNITLSDLTFIDIGANIGWFSLNMAALGVNVLAFEPMQHNIDLIQKSLAIPENIKSGVSGRIKLFPHGLGVKDSICIIYSHDINVGDGHVKCVDNEAKLHLPHNYSIRGKIPVHRLDDVLDASKLNIVAVKMDTEGYEANVVEGGTNVLLHGGAQAIVTEFKEEWIRGKGGDPEKMMKSLLDAGYKVMNTGMTKPLDNDWVMNEVRKGGLGKLSDLTLQVYSSSV